MHTLTRVSQRRTERERASAYCWVKNIQKPYSDNCHWLITVGSCYKLTSHTFEWNNCVQFSNDANSRHKESSEMNKRNKKGTATNMKTSRWVRHSERPNSLSTLLLSCCSLYLYLSQSLDTLCFHICIVYASIRAKLICISYHNRWNFGNIAPDYCKWCANIVKWAHRIFAYESWSCLASEIF